VRAILTFHSIDDSGSVLSYSPKIFPNLLDALHRCDIPVLDLDALLRPDCACGVALTFDDGIRTVFTQALPILQDYSVPSHLFLITGSVGLTNRWPGQPPSTPVFDMLRWSEIEALQRAGMRIEAHTENHPDLRRLSTSAVKAECESADEMIESRLGIRPRYFAYPYGHSNAAVRAYAKERYQGSLTTNLRMLRSIEDKTALPRLDTYYLRSKVIFSDIRSSRTRAFLQLRRALRVLRETF